MLVWVLNKHVRYTCWTCADTKDPSGKMTLLDWWPHQFGNTRCSGLRKSIIRPGKVFYAFSCGKLFSLWIFSANYFVIDWSFWPWNVGKHSKYFFPPQSSETKNNCSLFIVLFVFLVCFFFTWYTTSSHSTEMSPVNRWNFCLEKWWLNENLNGFLFQRNMKRPKKWSKFRINKIQNISVLQY